MAQKSDRAVAVCLLHPRPVRSLHAEALEARLLDATSATSSCTSSPKGAANPSEAERASRRSLTFLCRERSRSIDRDLTADPAHNAPRSAELAACALALDSAPLLRAAISAALPASPGPSHQAAAAHQSTAPLSLTTPLPTTTAATWAGGSGGDPTTPTPQLHVAAPATTRAARVGLIEKSTQADRHGLPGGLGSTGPTGHHPAGVTTQGEEI